MPTIEMPSGLVAEVRKIKGTELVKLAEGADDAGPDGGFGHVLSGCWLQTTDAGPYPHVEVGDEKPKWDRLLKGDVLYAFVFLRALSMPEGDEYNFDVHCKECRSRYGWTVRLSELPVQRLPEDSARQLRAQRPFEAHLPDGRVVKFHLSTIAQEEPVVRLMKQTKRRQSTLIDRLAGQVVSIDGVNPDIKARWRFLSELDMDELYRLREAFDAADCGLETEIQTRCTNRACGWEQDADLPLGRSFFAPRNVRRAVREAAERRQEELERESGGSSAGSSPASTPSGAAAPSTSSSGTSTGGAASLSPTGT